METMEDRFYKNPYIGKEHTLDLEEGCFQSEMAKAGKQLLEQLEQCLVNNPDSQSDTSIYTGSTGITLMYWYLTSTNKLPLSPPISQKLKDFAHRVTSGDMLKARRFTFLTGDAGPLVLALLISTNPKEKIRITQKLLDLQKLVYNEQGGDGTPTPNELLYGRAGFLYSLLLLNQQCGNNLKDSLLSPSLPPSVITQLVSYIIEDGIRKSTDENPPLYYEWHEKTYLGAAHGYVGILYMLLKAKDHMRPGHDLLVKESIDWLLTQRFSTGNLMSSIGSKEDKLIHWCHGAPGSIYLFLEAAKVYGDQKYLDAALKAGEVVWNRGLLKRSYSICHGVAGNAYALMAVYQHTKDEIWLKRSLIFVRWCFTWGTRATRMPDRPNSLFEGLAGTVYMIHDFLGIFANKSPPKFPAFELD